MNNKQHRSIDACFCGIAEYCCRGLELQRRLVGSTLLAMGQGKEEKKGHAIANAVVATASVALGYAALELGLGGVLKPGREAIQHSLEPEEEAAARVQATKLVEEVNHDATAHENTTRTPMEEEDLAKSLQEHAAAAPEAHTTSH
ncbi:hypothetical protein M758_6G112000 [Ceratodon purpureus]|nr:hypothetical protein M758_6G112000 [Ceratodon purpureus]